MHCAANGKTVLRRVMEVGHIGTSRSVLFEHRFEPQANAQTLMLKVKVEWEIKMALSGVFQKDKERSKLTIL